MKRVQFDRCGSPAEVLYVAEVAEPRPGAGEVLLRVSLTPLHPADLAYIRGAYVPPEKFPTCPGFEVAGIVEAVGAGVDTRHVGKRYLVSRVRGTWTEKMLAPADALVSVASDIPDEIACQLHVNPLTAYLLLAGVRRQGAIVQTAAGSAVGGLVAQLGQRAGRTVINVVRSAATAQALRAQGRAHVIDQSAPDWRDQVRAAAGDQAIAAAFDPVAGTTAVELLSVLSEGGELFLYGGLSGAPVAVNAMLLAGRDLAVRGFWLAPWFDKTPPAEKARVNGELESLFRQGELRIPIAAVYPLADIASAVRAAEQPGRHGKILLRG